MGEELGVGEILAQGPKGALGLQESLQGQPDDVFTNKPLLNCDICREMCMSVSYFGDNFGTIIFILNHYLLSFPEI